MKFLVTWRTFAGTEGNRSFDTRESMETFIKAISPNNWKSFSRWTFDGDQAVATLVPLD